MNDQQRAAMQGALLALEDAYRRDEHSAARWVYSEAMDDLREALRNASERMAQPQDTECPCGSECEKCSARCLPQGDPVAFEQWYEANVEAMNIADFKPWMSEAWDAAAEATKEKAAKVCDGIERKKWETLMKGGTLDGIAPKDCAAAIRSME